MRMRKKPNLIPRMEKCGAVQIKEPETLHGHWREAFSEYDRLYLELGCGKGGFTSGTAAAMPDVLLIAVERIPDAMVIGMERVTEAGLANVRFLCIDASSLLSIFADGEVQRVYINFCDPWPSNKHAKRRLTAPQFLRLYWQILEPGGEIHFKTDNSPLFEWSLEQFTQGRYELSEITRDLHQEGIHGIMTDYEAKFHGQGIPINRCVAKKPMEN